jgi:hypothetical protein
MIWFITDDGSGAGLAFFTFGAVFLFSAGFFTAGDDFGFEFAFDAGFLYDDDIFCFPPDVFVGIYTPSFYKKPRYIIRLIYI